jgi:two-component system chemotaxis sensor kinase CheA
LAIIDGLLVNVGENYYMLNLENVAECMEFTATGSEGSASGLRLIKGNLLPVLFLKNLLHDENRQAATQQVVIVKTGEHMFGLVVDKIVGQLQSVIKPLNHCFTPVHLFSGASILGDGTITLILDINRLGKMAFANIATAAIK